MPDASLTHWGLSYVFVFPRVFSLLTNDFYFDLGPHYVLKAVKGATVGGGDHNRPKRRIWCRWGLRYVFFFVFLRVFAYYLMFFFFFGSSQIFQPPKELQF